MASHKPRLRKEQHPEKKVWVIDKIKAKRGDEISWTAPDDSDITIWFPPKGDPLKIGTIALDSGESLIKVVSKSVKKGTYPYSVYCHEDNSMAEGGTGPEMIIE
jgi:plastocyanin